MKANAVLIALAEQGSPLEVIYTNYRNETATRVLRPLELWFGTSEYHPEEQYFLKALDCERMVTRDFALKDMQPLVPSVS